MERSHLEHLFSAWLCEYPELPDPVVEHRFDVGRRWRFDFAWPDWFFAVEIEGITRSMGGRGGVRMPGRHQGYDGFLRDAEKYERAMRLG